MKNLFFILLLIISQFAFSQKEANIWYFGNGAGVNFASGKPVAISNGLINTLEGCATISTKNGRLLLYSDGNTVRDSTHKVMPNGSGLKGSSTSTQSAIIFQKPGSSNLFYLFTVEPNFGENGCSYSEIDMSLNGGKGDIIKGKKNIRLFAPSTEKLCATKHINGKDTWLITLKEGSDTVFSYLITSSGVAANPVISKTGIKVTGQNNLHAFGQLKVSRNGKKIAFVNYGFDTSIIADFDAATGRLSNAWPFESNYAYGIEFSPKGNYLYVGEGEYQFNYHHHKNKVWQFNAKANTMKSFRTSKKLIENTLDSGAHEIGSLQLANDGKIYISVNYSKYLNVIHAPDSSGTNCRLQHKYVSLGKKHCYYGLPNFVSLNLPKAKVDIKGSCFNNSFQFNISDTEGLDSVKWNFGDKQTDTDFSTKLSDITYVYSNYGVYEVTLITYSNNQIDTIKSKISFEKPIADFIINDICETNKAHFLNKSNLLNEETIYKWNFGDGNTSNLKSPEHLYVIEGISRTYNVKLVIKTKYGCYDSIVKPVTINANPKSDFTYTAANNKWNFTPTQSGNTKYRWKFGDGDSSLTGIVSHSYKDGLSTHTVCLKATNAANCISETCKLIATTSIYHAQLPGFKIYPNPNTGNFTIEIDNPEKEILIEVYNLVGEKVEMVEMVEKVAVINLEVAPGIYLVKLRNGEMVYNQKVSITK